MDDYENELIILANEYEDALREADRNDRYYKVAMEEVRRLRGVARNYADFYDKIKAALDKQDWQLVNKALSDFK